MDKEFPQGHLRRARVIKVTPKDGFWKCPSCNEKIKNYKIFAGIADKK
ncbi:MAG: hypothetical protein NTX01_03915 [Candidatus Omnitrophica bacterium]|nr:hypothetical protein [Candidatus Omnitrophota bacterium]